MAKRVFFSFHYQDVIDFGANVVRNHWLTKPDREAVGFYNELQNTTVTTVLIGSEPIGEDGFGTKR